VCISLYVCQLTACLTSCRCIFLPTGAARAQPEVYRIGEEDLSRARALSYCARARAVARARACSLNVFFLFFVLFSMHSLESLFSSLSLSLSLSLHTYTNIQARAASGRTSSTAFTAPNHTPVAVLDRASSQYYRQYNRAVAGQEGGGSSDQGSGGGGARVFEQERALEHIATHTAAPEHDWRSLPHAYHDSRVDVAGQSLHHGADSRGVRGGRDVRIGEDSRNTKNMLRGNEDRASEHTVPVPQVAPQDRTYARNATLAANYANYNNYIPARRATVHVDLQDSDEEDSQGVDWTAMTQDHVFRQLMQNNEQEEDLYMVGSVKKFVAGRSIVGKELTC